MLLRSKHPDTPTNRRDIPDPVDTVHITTTAASIKTAIDSFPNGSAGGPDGLRPQILKELTSKDGGDGGASLTNRLSAFSNLVLAGGVPVFYRPFFFGANLLAFLKPAGGF